MFITAKVENPQGEVLDLMSKRGSFVVEHIDGLNPPPATINTNNIYGMDGSRLNSHYLRTRNIVLTMHLRGDQEESRQELYRFMDSNVPLRFYFQNKNRDVYIDGIVENIEDDMFVSPQTMQASIICPDPFFRSVKDFSYDIGNSQAGFEFPFSINQNEPIEFSTYDPAKIKTIVNDTTTELPFVIEIRPKYDVESLSGIIISNAKTGEQVGFNRSQDFPFAEGDVIRITTNPYRPTMVFESGGTTTNLLPYMIQDGTFWQLNPGENWLKVAVDPVSADSLLDIKILFTKLYRGV